MKKRLFKQLVCVMLAVCAFGVIIAPAASAQADIRVFIEGELITPRDARGTIVHPLLIDGTTYLPVRAIGEAFGREVDWDGAGQNVFVGRRPANIPPRGSNIRVFIDGSLIIPRDVQGNTVHPFIKDGTTYLPVRAIGEAFGKDIYWDARNQSVFVGRGTFTITAGEQTHTATMADILALSPGDVTARPRGEERNYTGVSLSALFRRLGVNRTGADTVTFTSEDGFSAALTMTEAMDARNTFIVIAQDGQPLGTRDDGGRGPFMSVVTQDPFANRFVRYLTAITLS